MKTRPASLILAVSLALVAPVLAQFAPGPNPVTGTVGAQTITGGTGTVNSSGIISTSGGTVAVLASGASTINNAGTIRNTSTGRAIDSTAAGSNITIGNTGTISSGSSDAVRINSADSSVSVTNSGTISVANGGQALDFAAISTGSNAVINQAGGIISTVGDDAIRPGTNGTINNAGTISATPTGSADPSGSDGIDLRTQKTGVVITNTGSISGRHGIATDGANVGPSSVTVNNNAGTISAINGSGINIDGINTSVTAKVTNLAGATIRGGVTAAATSGDGDGIDVDGLLTLENSGDILGYGAKGNGSDGGANSPEAVSIGGGTIKNSSSGRIIGSSLAADAPNGNTSRSGRGITVDNSSGGNALAATNIENDGLIQGKTGYGIRIIGTFADTITNRAGASIIGAADSVTTAAVSTGGGNDTINNAGTITHSGSNAATAIFTDAGDDAVNVIGGSASINGGMDGGAGSDTLTFTLGNGGSFNYGGTLSNFENANVVSGNVTMNGTFAFTLGGTTPGTGYDQLDVNVAAGSTFTLGGTSGLSLEVNFTPLANTEFILLDVADGSTVGGTFAGLAEGSEFTQDGQAFKISYVGGDGNDVSVTAVPEPSTWVCLLLGAGVVFFYGRRPSQQAADARL